MKKPATISVAILSLIIAFPAFGIQPYHSNLTEKPTGHLLANQAFDSKQGGETIETALEIELPFIDTGATCDNIDDYDEVCPYIGSTSPDVVYTFLGTSTETINVDLCGSAYDTKVYILDEDLNTVACNDDFYSGGPCGSYTSLLEEVPIETGARYYIVVDGYGGDCGEYYISVEDYCIDPPCLDAQCPVDGVPENEPALVEGYQDVFNSGCAGSQQAFQELIMPPGQTELNFCGYTGYYNVAGELQVDQDWFVMVANGSNIHIETNSSHFLSTDCDVLYLDNCNDISLLPYQMGTCTSGVINIPTNPGDIIYLRVQPTSPTIPECARRADLYTLKIQGIGETVVSTQGVKWGSFKSWFR